MDEGTAERETRAIQLGSLALVVQCSPLICAQNPGASHELMATYLLVGCMCAAEREKLRPDGAEWIGFVATEKKHDDGLSIWMGITPEVPDIVAKCLRDKVTHLGSPVSAQGASPRFDALVPRFMINDDGAELLLRPDVELSEEELGIYQQAAETTPIVVASWLEIQGLA
jgi:hypothetical protein